MNTNTHDASRHVTQLTCEVVHWKMRALYNHHFFAIIIVIAIIIIIIIIIAIITDDYYY